MDLRDEVNYNGRRYVTRKRFCELTGISYSTIKRYIAKGVVVVTHVDRHSLDYIDVELAKKNIAISNRQNRTKTGKKFKKLSKEARVSTPKEPNIAEPEADIERTPEMVDLDKLDKEKYADCLDADGEFDYDRLKDRLTVETYEFKLEKEKGLHIPKSEIMLSAKAIANVVKSNLDAIPSRYTAAFIALAENYSGYQFTDEQKTELRNRLKGVGPQVMVSIQAEIRKLADE